MNDSLIPSASVSSPPDLFLTTEGPKFETWISKVIDYFRPVFASFSFHECGGGRAAVAESLQPSSRRRDPRGFAAVQSQVIVFMSLSHHTLSFVIKHHIAVFVIAGLLGKVYDVAEIFLPQCTDKVTTSPNGV